MHGGFLLGKIGAHVSIAGGIANSVARALSIGCESFQIFTRNQRQWTPPPLSIDDASGFRKELDTTDLGPVLAHGSYLMNPASTDPTISNRSLDAILDELSRCHELGVGYLVIHPGSHGKETIQTGMDTVSSFLDKAYERSSGIKDPPMILLETTAGQGKSLGHTLEQLSKMIEGSIYHKRIGVCLDTCHMHASGYDLATENGYARTICEIRDMIGLSRIKGIHINDSKKEMGSRIDRHDNIGAGTIEVKAFSNLVNEKEFEAVPMILETPGGEDSYRKDIQFLMSLRSP